MSDVRGISLTERDKELARLRELHEDSVAGNGSVALLTGAPGSGKTALLSEFATRLGSGTKLLRAFGAEIEQELPFGVIDQLFPCRVDLPRDTADFSAMRGFWERLRTFAEQAPVAVFVDDAHHADEFSLQCVLYAARRLRTSRVFMVLSEPATKGLWRTSLRDGLLRLPHAYPIVLAPLSEAAVTERFGAGRHAATGGNPLLLTALGEDDASGTGEDLLVGDGYLQAVRALLDRGGRAHHQTAEALAVLDSDPTPELLAELLELEPAGVARSIAELRDNGVVSAHRFRRPEVRRAILESMPAERHARLKRRCAQLIGGESQPAFGLATAARTLETCQPDELSVDGIVDALMTLIHSDDLATARRWCDTFAGDPSPGRPPLWQARLDAARSEIALRQGDLRLAEEHAKRALTAFSPERSGTRVALPLACLLRARTELGGHAQAADLARRSLPAAVQDTRYGVQLRHARGRWHLAANRPRAALDDFLSCSETMAKLDADLPSLVPWRSEAALVHLRFGDGDRARALVLEQFARLDGTRSRARAITLVAFALTKPPSARAAPLTEAIEIFTEQGDRLELARALASLGHAYYLLRDHRRARTLTRRAENIASLCSVRLPGYPAPGGRHDSLLTTAERRVAVLAGSGHSNREIAHRLYITVSTVEQHLTHVYRKLSVHRRTDLPVRL
jgi:DNA-binding CsgD family transcriptional regulator